LKFINEEAASIHGNIRASSIYTTESGEWKLAGFEVLSSMKDDDPITYVRVIFTAPHIAVLTVVIEIWWLITGFWEIRCA